MEKRDRENEEIQETAENFRELSAKEKDDLLTMYIQKAKKLLERICGLIRTEEIKDEVEQEVTLYFVFGAIAALTGQEDLDKVTHQYGWNLTVTRTVTTYLMIEYLGYPLEAVDEFFPYLLDSVEKKENEEDETAGHTLVYWGIEAYCFIQDGESEKVKQIYDSLMGPIREAHARGEF